MANTRKAVPEEGFLYSLLIAEAIEIIKLGDLLDDGVSN